MQYFGKCFNEHNAFFFITSYYIAEDESNVDFDFFYMYKILHIQTQHISVLVLHLKLHIHVYHSMVAYSHKKQTGMTSICHW